MVTEGFARAVLPLFEEGLIDALEYSFEIGWVDGGLPAWAVDLLDHYSEAQRLWGHGVTFSPLTDAADTHHEAWLGRVAAECQARAYRGVSEHYGFMREDGVHGGAPLPPPPGPATVRRGVDALTRLAAKTGGPVGLENLALALSPQDIWAQGPALSAMLDAVDGYLVLDLHNLDCQVHNFGVRATDVLDTYPLARARCIHVSGGSWSHPSVGGQPRRFRRDTHDGAVPSSVLALLPMVLARCPNLETVILERLGPSVGDADGEALRDEARAIAALIGAAP